MSASVYRVLRILVLVAAAVGLTRAASAQTLHGVVLDQTGLPLPGATIQLVDGDVQIASTTSGADGTFAIDAGPRGVFLVAALEGFETRTVARGDAARIVLDIARAVDSAIVIAEPLAESSPTAATLGSRLTATDVARLPSKNFKARESLPLLPSVIRGADGLMQLGGARAYQTPLSLDGFNIADPAMGLSSVNLPYEAVKGVEALRDPMAVTYGGLLGGLVKMESATGGQELNAGVQGFIPRPRFTTPGFGRLEGIFPRAHVSGSAGQGRVQYMAAGEYDYERIPVPGVTGRTGPDLIEESGIMFGRVDARVSSSGTLTVEGFSFPAGTHSYGLSPRRDQDASVDLSSRDTFFGVTGRVITGPQSVLTVRGSAFGRDANSIPNGLGISRLSPVSWTGNWFSRFSRDASRYAVAASWDRVVRVFGRQHDMALAGEVATQSLRGTVEESAIVVADPAERVVRTVEFGAPGLLSADDRLAGAALRDVWHVNDRVTIESGVRLDSSALADTTPSGRVGLRYALDPANRTVIKGGFGTFVGTLPLAAATFGNYPARIDRSFDPENGNVTRNITWRPAVGRLLLPRARTAVIGIERALGAALDIQAVFTHRRTSRLATVDVPEESGPLTLDSGGTGTYREIQFSGRRRWENDQQLFVSYVNSSSTGELNEFSSLFQTMDAPLLQPGGQARTANDSRHRVLAWGTFNLPRRVVVSPVTEIRTGFPYSALTMDYRYDGTPNTQRFPVFMATDMVIYKTFTAYGRNADVGIQLFNLTNHHNYRDVYPVSNTLLSGQFTNSVGTILRGYFLLKW